MLSKPIIIFTTLALAFVQEGFATPVSLDTGLAKKAEIDKRLIIHCEYHKTCYCKTQISTISWYCQDPEGCTYKCGNEPVDP